MRRALLLLLASGCASVAAAWLHPRQDHFAAAHWRLREVGVADIARMPERLLVDTRSRERYEADHIPGALFLSEEVWDETLPDFLERWQPESRVIVYCDGQACATSKRAALHLLADLPDAHLYVLKGGFPAWKAAGLPTVSSASDSRSHTDYTEE